MKLEDQIEKLISYAGDEHRYQYFSSAVMVLLYINFACIATTLPYLERRSIVEYFNDKGEKIQDTINYEICETNYNVSESFEYSWVIQFGIECDKEKTGLMSSLEALGTTCGALFFALVSKYVPHKKIILFSGVGYSISVFLMTLCQTNEYFYLLLIALIVAETFSVFIEYSALMIIEEIVASSKRSLYGSIVGMGFPASGVIFSLVYFFQHKWVLNFYILMSSSLFLTLIVLVFIFESPRHYINKRDIKTTLEILGGVAKFNGKTEEFHKLIASEEGREILRVIQKDENITRKTVSENDMAKVKGGRVGRLSLSMNEGIISNSKAYEYNEENVTMRKTKNNREKSPKIGYLALIKYPSVRYIFFFFSLLWIICCGVYDSISVGSKNLGGNFYLNQIILFGSEIFSYIISGYLIEIKFLGRRRTIWLLLVIFTVSILSSTFMKLNSTLDLVVNLIARFCISPLHVVCFTYSLELYPTPIRSVGFAINGIFGNVGSVVLNFLQEILTKKQYNLLYSFFCIICSISLIFMEETRGKPMVETIKEMEEEKLKKKQEQKIEEETNENIEKQKEGIDTNNKNIYECDQNEKEIILKDKKKEESKSNNVPATVELKEKNEKEKDKGEDEINHLQENLIVKE